MTKNRQLPRWVISAQHKDGMIHWGEEESEAGQWVKAKDVQRLEQVVISTIAFLNSIGYISQRAKPGMVKALEKPFEREEEHEDLDVQPSS